LTLLAPEIVEAIIDGRQPPNITLATLLQPFPGEWVEQMTWMFCGAASELKR
jgi:hypothetical protein